MGETLFCDTGDWVLRGRLPSDRGGWLGATDGGGGRERGGL